MAMTMEELEAEVVRLRREVEQDPFRAALRRMLEELARNDPSLGRAVARPSLPPDEPPAPDLERASANALEKLRRVRQQRRQRG